MGKLPIQPMHTEDLGEAMSWQWPWDCLFIGGPVNGQVLRVKLSPVLRITETPEVDFRLEAPDGTIKVFAYSQEQLRIGKGTYIFYVCEGWSVGDAIQALFDNYATKK